MMCGYCGCSNSEEETHHHDKRIIDVEQDILAMNQQYANQNRDFLKKHNILCFNLVSSPGSGKTTLLIELIGLLKKQLPIYVIEGDQQTDIDKQRIAKTGIQAIQINTGKTCHIGAHRISHALTDLKPQDNSMLFIENVGNLVCPALFDLGERCKVVILSVTEGDDKPLKYPNMFDEAELMIINKIDLLPYVNFNIDRCIEYAKRINPKISVLQTSATSKTGLKQCRQWLESHYDAIIQKA